MNFFKITLTILFLTSYINADIKPVINAGFSFGGDNLLTIEFDDGDEETLNAGDSAYIEVGVSIWTPELRNFDTQLLFGYSGSSIDAQNGNAYLTKYTIRALEIYYSPNFNFGVGFLFHSKPELAGERFIRYDREFKDTWGTTFQIGFNVDNNAIIGIRADFIEYEDKAFDNRYIDANAFGLFFSYTFY